MTNFAVRCKLAQLIRETPSIEGFSYPLLRLLTDRLDEIKVHDRLFKRGKIEAMNRSDDGMILTNLGEMIVGALAALVGTQIIPSHSGITKFIEDANELLSTFEIYPL